jgi:ATP-binding cassette subfamily C (CFTR/MRP) protein 4
MSPPPAPSPYDTATPWQHWTFSYVVPLLTLGASRPLTFDDLPPLAEHDNTKRYSSNLKAKWDEELVYSLSINRRPSLWRAIYRSNTKEFWQGLGWLISEHCMMITMCLLLRQLLFWLESNADSSGDLSTNEILSGLWIALLLFLASFIQASSHHQLYFITMRAGWNLRIALTILTNNKLLTLSSTSASVFGGRALNLMSTDVFRFDTFMVAMYHYFSGPVDFVVILFLLTRELTFVPAALGCLVVFADVFLKLYLGKRIGIVRQTTAGLTDTRVKMTKEALSGMETLKSYSWESVFLKKLTDLRQREHASINRAQIIKGINFSMVFASPALAFLVMFGSFFARESAPLTIQRVFTSVALINVLRNSIGKEMTRATENGPECNVAVKRFEDFLQLPEVHQKVSVKPKNETSDEGEGDAIIEMTNASFTWPRSVVAEQKETEKGARSASSSGDSIDLDLTTMKDSQQIELPPQPCLQNLNLTLWRGELLVVVGAVASGKSAFINAILNELNLTTGEISVKAGSSIGYASQTPFISTGSIKSNITFGSSDPEEKNYLKVIEGCALSRDLNIFVDGDATMLGERGVNLSGGQRARVGLARAIYSAPDLLLLDDPLAAVDPEVRGKLIRTIRGSLCKKSAVVLVTHHVSYIPIQPFALTSTPAI